MLSVRYKDERGTTRKLSNTKVSCEFGRHRWVGDLFDISPKGIFVETNKLPKEGGCVSLEFKLPYPDLSGSVRFQLKGKIVRTQRGDKRSLLFPKGFAAQFVNLTKSEALCLKKFTK